MTVKYNYVNGLNKDQTIDSQVNYIFDMYGIINNRWLRKRGLSEAN